MELFYGELCAALRTQLNVESLFVCLAGYFSDELKGLLVTSFHSAPKFSQLFAVQTNALRHASVYHGLVVCVVLMQILYSQWNLVILNEHGGNASGIGKITTFDDDLEKMLTFTYLFVSVRRL